METLDATRPFHCPIFIDSDYFESVSQVNLDNLATWGGREPLGVGSRNIIAEYGALVHYCSVGWMNEHAKDLPSVKAKNLVIVIDAPNVYFCFNGNSNGVFIEQYNQEKHGLAVCDITKESFSELSNIDARGDGWWFAAEMCRISEELNK